LYNPTDNNTPLPEAIANLTQRHTTIDPIHTQSKETKLYKPHKLYPEESNNGMWPLPDTIYDALHTCFNIQRVIHCNPVILPLRAEKYISHDPEDAAFAALPYTKSAWRGTSLALPKYKAGKLKTALEQAIYSAHAHRHTSPSSQLIILPNWIHTPYLARNLHKSHTQKLTYIPFRPISTAPLQKCNPKLNIYLVANEKALSILDQPKMLHTLREEFTKIEGAKTSAISLILTMKDPQHIDNSQSYTDPYPETTTRTRHNRRYPIRPFQAAWNSNDYIYTDG
jgi:hypothetical protein